MRSYRIIYRFGDSILARERYDADSPEAALAHATTVASAAIVPTLNEGYRESSHISVGDIQRAVLEVSAT